MRRLLASLAVGTALLGGPSWAEEYLLDTGDTIRLHVFEWPDLSGEFTVNAQGQFNLPMAGRIDARGMTLDEASDRIQATLNERMGSRTPLNMTVDMAEYRSFYVLGTEMAGAFEYRPGLTVLQAVALAGGPLRLPDTAGARVERDAISARGDMLLARSQLDVLRVRIARLEAELDGEDGFDLPAALESDASEAGIAEAMRTETLMFERRREAREGTLAHIRRMIELYEEELASVRAQIESREDQIAIIEEDYENARSLVEQGLAPAQRELALRQELAIAVTLRRDLDTRIVQIRQNIEESRREIDEIHEAFFEEALEDLQDTRAEIVIADATYATAQRLLAEAQQFETTIRRAGEADGATMRFFIQRQEAGEHDETEVTETTAVRPCDVIIVERTLASSDGTSQRVGQ
jgi:polysaccharide biosynthesis/export protein ExoF